MIHHLMRVRQAEANKCSTATLLSHVVQMHKMIAGLGLNSYNHALFGASLRK